MTNEDRAGYETQPGHYRVSWEDENGRERGASFTVLDGPALPIAVSDVQKRIRIRNFRRFVVLEDGTEQPDTLVKVPVNELIRMRPQLDGKYAEEASQRVLRAMRLDGLLEPAPSREKSLLRRRYSRFRAFAQRVLGSCRQ